MTTLLELLTRQKLEPTTPAQPLAAALIKLDIEPFNAVTVRDYKQAKRDQLVASESQRLADCGWSTDIGGADNYGDDVRNDLGPRWKDDDCYLFRCRDFRSPLCFAYGWHRDIFAFAPASLVPAYVQRKAMQIAHEVPGVIFQTDTLESRSASYDPFLIAKLGSEEYYFECWDETFA
jgi:hypothetical protein